jgi:hypothetical protein
VVEIGADQGMLALEHNIKALTATAEARQLIFALPSRKPIRRRRVWSN